jgi:hypothetical protein
LCSSLFVNSATLHGSDPSRIIYSHEGCGRNTRSVRHHTPPHVVLQHPSGSRICNQVSHIGTRACLPGLLASALFPCLRLCTPQTTTAWLGAKAQLFRSTRLLHPANNLSQVCTSTTAATLPSENNFATSWPTSSWPLTQPCCMSKHLASCSRTMCASPVKSQCSHWHTWHCTQGHTTKHGLARATWSSDKLLASFASFSSCNAFAAPSSCRNCSCNSCAVFLSRSTPSSRLRFALFCCFCSSN